MTDHRFHESAERDRERVLAYLYGALTPTEAEDFRAEMSRSPVLARLLEEEERLHRAVPMGSGAELPEGLLEESRLRLRDALRHERPASAGGRLAHLLDGLIPRLSWAAGAVALLACGILLGRGTLVREESLAAQKPGELVDVQVRSYDAATGEVDLELCTLSISRMRGALGDRSVQAVLAAALVGRLEPGPRLDAVELLRDQAAATDVREALSHALLNDDNPGVRLAAAEALSGFASHDPVRQALQLALLRDGNPGVRLVAFGALSGHRDAATVQTLERAAHFESNEYIRTQADDALRGPRPAATTHL